MATRKVDKVAEKENSDIYESCEVKGEVGN